MHSLRSRRRLEKKMNKTVKRVLFGCGVTLVIGLTILFGYLGFHGKKVIDRSHFSYTDKVEMKNEKLDVIHSGITFENNGTTSYKGTIRWGDSSRKYSFLTLTKIIAPSGKVEAWVSGDWGDCGMEFELTETGTYMICSDYYCTDEDFRSACRSLDPDLKIENDNFVFPGEEGSWEQKIDIDLVASK